MSSHDVTSPTDVRYPPDMERFRRMTAEEIRSAFLIDGLFRPGEVRLVYSHVDRAVAGSVTPAGAAIPLTISQEVMAAEYFAQRREIGVLNCGGVPGTVSVDGAVYELAFRDALYIGRGSREVVFASNSAPEPARFYLASFPAHAAYPTTKVSIGQAAKVSLGSREKSNQRTIYKYICPDTVESCQLVMGLTALEPGSVWNTMPCHTHPRRSEIYLYLGLGAEDVVWHLAGPPAETRHIVVRDSEAVLSPSWSIHAGCGTAAYSFIWAMGGENQSFNDMDGVAMQDIR